MANSNNEGWFAAGAAGLSLIGSAITGKKNREFQKEQNQLDRDWEQHMYNVQRQDALSDWHMQNLYNHPLSQMQRFRDAKLNPHLIYGNMANSPTVRNVAAQASSKPVYNLPTNMIGDAIGKYQDLRLMTAQTDNLAQQTAIGLQEEMLKQAQTAETITRNAKGKYELELAKDIRDAVVMRADLENKKINADIEATEAGTDVLLNRDAREAIANGANVELTLNKVLESKLAQVEAQYRIAQAPEERAKLQQEIQNLKATHQNLIVDGQLKELDRRLKEKGIQPHDPIYLRAIAQATEGKKTEDILRGIWRIIEGKDPNTGEWVEP